MILRLMKWLPLVGFLTLLFFLSQGLWHDPKLLPSALKDKPLPSFELMTVENTSEHLSSYHFKGHVTLLNVWASWCVGCQQEHTMLMQLAQQHQVLIYGLNWKDDLQSAQNWLKLAGDPYQKSGFDNTGMTAINLGVYGVPETFIIDKYGMIRYRHTGPVTQDVWRRVLWPIIQKWQA